jgi:hypothetical protein
MQAGVGFGQVNVEVGQSIQIRGISHHNVHSFPRKRDPLLSDNNSLMFSCSSPLEHAVAAWSFCPAGA